MKKLCVYLIFFIISVFINAESKEFKFQTGLYIKNVKNIYVGMKKDTFYFPYFQIKYKNINFDGDRIDYSLYKNENLYFNANIKLNYDGYNPEKSEKLQNMKKKYGGILAGIELKYFSEKTGSKLKLGLDKDISENSDGIVSEIEAQQLIPIINNLYFGVNAGVKYMDSKYTNYYYGVKENEKTAVRDIYNLSSDINKKAGISLIYFDNKKFTALISYEKEFLGENIKNSPIVDKNMRDTITFFAAYNFK